jgi:hypothetical protein
MNKQKLLKKVTDAWNLFENSYQGLPDCQLTQAGVTGIWSIKDIIAHVTWWEEEALRHLPTVLAGGQPPRYSVLYGGIDAFNALMTEKKKSLSLPEVLRQQRETHRRLLEFLGSVTEDQVERDTRFRHRLRLDTYSHYRKHAEAIRQWRQQQ